LKAYAIGRSITGREEGDIDRSLFGLLVFWLIFGFFIRRFVNWFIDRFITGLTSRLRDGNSLAPAYSIFRWLNADAVGRAVARWEERDINRPLFRLLILRLVDWLVLRFFNWLV
jgi:hypothetical protein